MLKGVPGPRLLLVAILIIAGILHLRYTARMLPKAWKQRTHGSQAATMLGHLPPFVPGVEPFMPIGIHCNLDGVARARTRGMAQFHWVPAVVLEAPEASSRVVLRYNDRAGPGPGWAGQPPSPSHPHIRVWCRESP